MTDAEIVDILHEAKAHLKEQYDNKIGSVVDHKLQPYEDVINNVQRLINHFKKPKKSHCSFWADGEHHWKQGYPGLANHSPFLLHSTLRFSP